MTITSATRDPAGTSTFTFTATGEASIVYTGTLSESGTVTIGPQNLPNRAAPTSAR